MDNPRPQKVAVVDEVRSRLSDASGAILTEYRGLTVSEMADLRQALEKAGGEYKVYKNTLVKLATAGTGHEGLDTLLTGPTAIAFVNGEISAVAKALRDYARGNPNLVVKGGMFGAEVLSTAELSTLADLPSRDVLLARVAGAIAAPLQKMAGLLQALPRNLAYGLSALIEQMPPEEAPTPADAAPAAPADSAPAAPADVPEAEGTKAEEAESEEATTETEAPAAEGVASAEAPTEPEAAPTEEAEPQAVAETTEQVGTAPIETEATETEATESQAAAEPATEQAEAEQPEAAETATEQAETDNDVTSDTKEQSDNG
jgi:large subunit ribosomal protein L10